MPVPFQLLNVGFTEKLNLELLTLYPQQGLYTKPEAEQARRAIFKREFILS